MRYSILSAALIAVLVGAFSVAQERSPGKTTQPAEKHEMSAESMVKEMRSMNEMMTKMLGNKDAGYEGRFIDLMIPHHEGAVLMAKDALKNSTKPDLKEMAQKMISEQEKEIAMLKSWRKKWYPR